MNLRFYILFRGVSYLLSISFHANNQAVVYLVWRLCNHFNVKMLPALTGVFCALIWCRVWVAFLGNTKAALGPARCPAPLGARPVTRGAAAGSGRGAASCVYVGPGRRHREQRAPTAAARGGRHGRVREPAQEDAHQGTAAARPGSARGRQRGPGPGGSGELGREGRKGAESLKWSCPAAGLGWDSAGHPRGRAGHTRRLSSRLQEGQGELCITDRGGVGLVIAPV